MSDEHGKKEEWLKKGKKHLYRLFYGRAMLISILVIAQMVVPMVIVHNLSTYSIYWYGAMFILTMISILHIFNGSSDPTIKMSWLILVSALTPFGCVLYLWVQTDLGHRQLKRKAALAMESGQKALPPDTGWICVKGAAPVFISGFF